MENIKVLLNTTANKKDLVKAGVATTTFKDVIGEAFTMVGVIAYEKTENDEVMTVVAVKREDGEFISSISPTVANSLDVIRGAYSDEEISEGIEVVVKSKKSNGGREFLYIDLI